MKRKETRSGNGGVAVKFSLQARDFALLKKRAEAESRKPGVLAKAIVENAIRKQRAKADLRDAEFAAAGAALAADVWPTENFSDWENQSG
jgi:hypothetical protein